MRAKSILSGGKVRPVVWLLIGLLLLFSLTIENYFSISNFQNILLQSAPLMILAFGQTLIVLTQGTDLSLGAQVSLSTVLWVFWAQKGIPLVIGALAVLVCMMTFGTINGILVSKGKLPPYIATLGMQNIVSSIAFLLTGGTSIYLANSDFFYKFTSTKVLFLSLPFWAAILMYIVVWIALHRTRFGANIIALGGNQEALQVAGINVVKSMAMTYGFVGLIAGISGLLATCRVESGQPLVGSGWEFNAIAATLLGGTSMREGKGGVSGTVFGVLLIYVLQNGLNLSGISSVYHNALMGSVVLLTIVLDTMIGRKTES